MAIKIISGNSLFSKKYLYPITGRVKVLLEATDELEIFLVGNQNADSIENQSKFLNISGDIRYTRQEIRNETIPAPEHWKQGWKIIIFNPSNKDVAVYFKIREAEFELPPDFFSS